MVKDEINKDLNNAENLVKTIKQRSEKCDPNIVYPLEELHAITERLFKKYDEISKDSSFHFRFNEIIKSKETYRGDFTYNCICMSKSK